MTASSMISAIYDVLFRLLNNSEKTFSEYDLIREIGRQELFIGLSEKPDLALFQKHFLVMHVLYQLQDEFKKNKHGYLWISALAVYVQPITAALSSAMSLDDASPTDLKAYYLDIENFSKETGESVEDMLADFWKKYASFSQYTENNAISAAEILDIIWPCDQKTLRDAYRRCARDTHPDHGGNHEDFIRVKDAYELLRNL